MSPYERVSKLLAHSEEHFAAGSVSLGFAAYDSAWLLLQHLDQPVQYASAVLEAERILRESILPLVPDAT